MMDFVKAVAGVSNLYALCVLAKQADAKDSKDPDRYVNLVLGTAIKFIGQDISRLGMLAMSFSTFSSRLLLVDSFIDDCGITSLDDAIALIDLIKHGQRCVCETCQPEAVAIIELITDKAQDYVIPTAKSPMSDLVKMAKLLPRSKGQREMSRAKAQSIAEAAKRAKIAEEAAEVADAIPFYNISHDLLNHFLDAVGIETIGGAIVILRAAKSRGAGGKEVADKVIRQVVAKKLEVNIIDLLTRMTDFVSQDGANPLASLMGISELVALAEILS
jgi:hypothetical protein